MEWVEGKRRDPLTERRWACRGESKGSPQELQDVHLG